MTMHSRGVVTALAALVVSALIVVLAPGAGAATITVNCSTQDLQNKIDHADPGSVLLIKGTCKGNFQVDRKLTLKGNPTATLDGTGSGTTLTLTGVHVVHLVALTITGGQAFRGGGIYRGDGGVLTLNKVVVTENTASGVIATGGGIYSLAGSIKVTNSTLTHNRAVASGSGTIATGGGVETHGPFTMVASKVSFNRASSNGSTGATASGGGILVTGAALSITSSHLDGNRVVARAGGGTLAGGGAIFDGSSDEPLSISKSTFSGNSVLATGVGNAEARGGAVEATFGTGVISGSTFVGNRLTATSDGARADGAGGALRTVAGTKLSVRSCRIRGSSATGSSGTDALVTGGGISSEGQTAIVGSSISDGTIDVLSASGEGTARGGGIHQEYTNAGDSLTIARSTVGRNHLVAESSGFNGNGHGGGVDSFAPTKIVASTVSRNTIDSTAHGSNTAEAHGGGLYLYPGGPDSGYSITNSTIAGNAAKGTASSSGTTDTSGGGIDAHGAETITNTTIARNHVSGSGGTHNVRGGGLFVDLSVGPEPVKLKATILALNQAPVGPDCFGPVDSGGRNLVRKTGGCNFGSKPTDKLHKDPKLGPLADNGGPTRTLALLAGSPALNAIPQAACAVGRDQRGVKRPQGSRCDMGAYERKL